MNAILANLKGQDEKVSSQPGGTDFKCNRPMAVHCSSNVILLAIEYFIDSKGERQKIKLLSTQSNYSPLFGLKKLVIIFISSDKTDKKLYRSWIYKNTLPNEAKGWPRQLPRHGV